MLHEKLQFIYLYQQRYRSIVKVGIYDQTSKNILSERKVNNLLSLVRQRGT